MAVGIATDIWEPEELQRLGLDLAYGLPHVAGWLTDAATGKTDALGCVASLFPTLSERRESCSQPRAAC